MFFQNPIGAWAKKTGLEYNMSLLAEAPPSAALTAQYLVANTVVFKKVKAALGLDKCKRFFSAAAPASRETLEYFMSLDIREAIQQH